MKTLLPAALTLALLGACTATTTPQLDGQLGNAVKLARSQQILDPEAVNRAGPPSGMDGKAAHSAYELYQKSFKAPEPQTTAFTIGVGTAGGK